jgi:hypothetical protein
MLKRKGRFNAKAREQKPARRKVESQDVLLSEELREQLRPRNAYNDDDGSVPM